jgi:hypothetical protein
MLTIFSTPKPFEGHIGMIQRNAIGSWKRLRPEPQIILFGRDAGVAEAARQFGLDHVAGVAASEFGTPLVSDLFEKAQRLARHELLCFVNADIILTASLLRVVEAVSKQHRRFLMLGTPWNLRVEQQLDFTAPDWEERLREWVKRAGQPPRFGADMIVFPRGFYDRIPPFAIGRMWYDGWLGYKACRAAIPAVDVTPFVLAVHQDHPGTTHAQKFTFNEEVHRNARLAGWWATSFVAADLPYELEPDGRLRRKGLRERLRPRAHALLRAPVVMIILQWTYTLRRKIGLYRRRRQPAKA